MVDGGMELWVGVLPLAVQVLSAQRAAMAREGKETVEEWNAGDTPTVRT